MRKKTYGSWVVLKGSVSHSCLSVQTQRKHNNVKIRGRSLQTCLTSVTTQLPLHCTASTTKGRSLSPPTYILTSNAALALSGVRGHWLKRLQLKTKALQAALRSTGVIKTCLPEKQSNYSLWNLHTSQLQQQTENIRRSATPYSANNNKNKRRKSTGGTACLVFNNLC